ncbi:type II toxin-antitoxin system RelE/ParE family toxin [Amorphus sp. MBR-141]
MKVVITQAAWDNMLHIGAWIKSDNPARADTFVAELHAQCEALGHAPKGYPLVPGWEHLGIRRRPFGDYLIFYRIAHERIEVLHVVHGARAYERILFPDA